jgi:hypothetical protein
MLRSEQKISLEKSRLPVIRVQLTFIDTFLSPEYVMCSESNGADLIY